MRCRKAGISEATFYNWRKRYGGMMPSEVRKLRQIEEENAKLKRLVADLSLDKAMQPGGPKTGSASHTPGKTPAGRSKDGERVIDGSDSNHPWRRSGGSRHRE